MTLPTRDALIRFVEDSAVPVGKREIAKAFAVEAGDRAALRALIRALEEDGVLARGRGRKLAPPDALPAVTMLDVTGLDEDGAPIARPLIWKDADGPPPRIEILDAPRRRGRSAPAGAPKPGDRVLARMERLGEARYRARPIKILPQSEREAIIGVFEGAEGGGRIRPADKKSTVDLIVDAEEAARAIAMGIAHGDVVAAERLPRKRDRGPAQARILDRVGGLNEPQAFSLMAIKRHGLPDRFSAEALAEAEAAKAPRLLDGDEDLRPRPLVTIDGEDARDFDDAVWAQADDDPGNPGGFKLMVAIADVAAYVRPGSALDRDARERGNSAYFPDRVVPMLPETLSNGWCSLRPDEDRRCLAVEITIDRDGAKRGHRFTRGLMRSAARLTYGQAQAAADGAADEAAAPLVHGVIHPLFAAYGVLRAARETRGALEIEGSERQVVLDDKGQTAAIVPRARYDSHKLIEEFMILANVCAAETLEAQREPTLYRVHDRPAPEKVEALSEALKGLDIAFGPGAAAKPSAFNRVLAQAAQTEAAVLVNELVLRAQAQAVYQPDNIGHYGLALRRYAHFTSPIRRYADLCVHRGLIAALKLGAGGRGDDPGDLSVVGAHISSTERRAAQAERETIDRYVAAFLAERGGALFDARISGVQRFGLFVTLSETGADGLIPVQSLGEEWWAYDDRAHTLTGERSGRRFRLGDAVEVRLLAADPVSGRLELELMGGGGAPARRTRKAAVGRKAKPPKRRTRRR